MFNGFGNSFDGGDKGIEAPIRGPEPISTPPSLDELKRKLEEVLPTLPEPDDLPDAPSAGKPEAEEQPQVQEAELQESTIPTDIPVVRATADGGEVEGSGETDVEGVDDNGNPYLDENGDYLPNNTFEIDGTVYKTDDHGNIYSGNGELYPNDTFELNGQVYTTDDQGRITSVDGKPVLSPENSRDQKAQKEAGGEDRQEGDQGGHVIGRDMGGDGGEGNIVPMDGRINQSDYKRMENEIKRALAEGKDVHIQVEITYSGDSKRPDTIKVTVTIDGKETVYTFDNNRDGSLEERVQEVGTQDDVDQVKSVLEETGGDITSIKEEYDEDGNLVKVTVTITYTDDSGTHRTQVVIDNPQGGKSE